ncbi:MAG: DedA family protein [Bryobacteraceae bacterium]
MESLLAWLSHYGYFGLFGLLMFGFIGLPVPDETLLIFSGYLISRGRLHPGLTFFAGFAGSTCGISLSYVIGRTLGHRFVRRYGRYVRITEQRIQRVHRWFLRTGEWLLPIGYFIPGVRHLTAFVAGMSDLEYYIFAAFAYSGAAIWVGTFLTLGYFVGDEWQAALRVVHRYTVLAAILLAMAIGAAWWIQRRRRWD